MIESSKGETNSSSRGSASASRETNRKEAFAAAWAVLADTTTTVVGIPNRLSRHFRARSAPRRLLESEIETADVRTRTINQILDRKNVDDAAIKNARRLLKKARKTLDGGSFISARHQYYAAIRWETIAFAQLEDINLLDGDASHGTSRSEVLTAIVDVGRKTRHRSGMLNRLVTGRGIKATPSPVTDGGLAVRKSNGLEETQTVQTINPYVLNPLELRARRLLFEIEESLSSWREEAARDVLTDEDGTLKENVNVEDVLAALKLLHEYYIARDLRVKGLRAQLTYFIVISFLATFAILAIAQPAPSLSSDSGSGLVNAFLKIVFSFLGIVPIEFAGETPLFNATPADITAPGYLPFIVLFGVLGAAVSGLLPLTTELRSKQLPEGVVTFRLAIARVTMGAAAAVALFAFLQSGVVNLGELTPGLVLAVSFAAGFSERFLMRAVRALTREDMGMDTRPHRNER